MSQNWTKVKYGDISKTLFDEDTASFHQLKHFQIANLDGMETCLEETTQTKTNIQIYFVIVLI